MSKRKPVPSESPSKRERARADSKSSVDEAPPPRASSAQDSQTERWSKSKKKRMRKQKAKQKKDEDVEEVYREPEQKPSAIARSDQVEIGRTGQRPSSSSLQYSFKHRLSGSRFRTLNEELYTTPSMESYKRFSTSPELYHQYHEGFRYQVERWPVNPVNVICQRLRTVAAKRQSSSPLVVADFGCGDAELAKQLLRVKGKKNDECPFLVHSFDLVASSDLVTACDMANVPLPEKSVDVGVFCLSLMGTNLADFIREAHRVLKPDGQLTIAEVRSRFESRAGHEDLQKFFAILSQLGFDCLKEDKTNKMFFLLDLRKNSRNPDPSISFTAKPCIYKRR